MIYKLVTRVIQYFCFPERPIKVGTSCISRKGGILEKGRLIQKRMGSMIPLTNYFHRPPQNFRSSPNLIFCSGPPPPNYFSLKFFVPPLKLGGGAATMCSLVSCLDVGQLMLSSLSDNFKKNVWTKIKAFTLLSLILKGF